MADAVFEATGVTADDVKPIFGDALTVDGEEVKPAEQKPEEKAKAETEEKGEEKAAEEAQGEEEQKPSARSVKKKIDASHRRVGELETLVREQYQHIRQLIEASQQGKQTKTEEKTQEKAESALANKPTLDQFDSYDKYVEALADWSASARVRNVIEDLAKQDAQRSAEKVANERSSAYREKAAAFAEKHEDFEEVVHRPDIQLPQHVIEAVMEADNGPEIAYYLGQNEKVAKSFANMSPTKAVFAIGKLSKELEPVKRPKSKAPEPVENVGGGGETVVTELDPANMSYKEFKRARTKGLL